MRLTPEKRKLLQQAFENNNVLRMEEAFKVYSSKEAAKKSVKSLEAHGFLAKKDVGKFELVNLSEDMKYLEEEAYGARDFIGIILKRVMKRIYSD